ncbi:MAG: TIGR03557 family F420-dependent LLM class oxidoreductase [Thermoleophilaceae bacterium]|nr:TIGR03557 family F420-dependent LLM class oxidoreductase [Thermoleophilaceae bacterium]
MRFFYGASQEQFPPSDLLRQAAAAERAGFDGISSSDHLQPWWEPGESGHTWPWLGAALQATSRVPVGTGVTTPGPRYHPVMVAQAWATMEEMYPGRTFLGFGSGEALNEAPLGEGWPPVGEQIERMDEALELIDMLWNGERVDYEGRHWKTDAAKLHTLPEKRPPIWVSAFGPKAAKVAGRWGQGVWTLADPEKAPEVIEAYRAAADDANREPGEVVLQALWSWAETDEEALRGAEVWKGAQPEEFFKDDWHDPQSMVEEGRRQLSDEEFMEAAIVSSDPDVHSDRIRELEKLGATVVVLQNNSGADPHAAIETYRERVLPALKGTGVSS